MLGNLIAAGVAAAVTYFELDQVFSFPKKSPGRWGIRLVSGAFVLVNAGLAFALYALLHRASILSDVDAWLGGLLVGAGYLSLVRLKFATVNDQPFGFEFFYDLAKKYAYRRINRRVIEARQTAAKQLADQTSLADLVTKAKMNISLDSLLDEEEQSEAKAWILRVVDDGEVAEDEKKLILADFVLSGSRSAHA